MSGRTTTLRDLVSFPDPVNDNAARVVAAGVVLLALATVITGWMWLTALLAVGFAARVLSGPRFSLLGRLAQVIAPRLGPARLVPGPPKRFAQAIGLVLAGVAALAGLAFDAPSIALALVGVLLIFASFESVLGCCAGCRLYGLLTRTGAVPADGCAECTNIWLRYENNAARHDPYGNESYSA